MSNFAFTKFIFIYLIVLILLTISCLTNTLKRDVYVDENRNIIEYNKLETQEDKYKYSILKYRNNEDIEAINLLLECAYYALKNPNTATISYKTCIDEAIKMLDRLHIEVKKRQNNLEYDVRVTRSEHNRKIAVRKARIRADYISTATYSWSYMTDDAGYAIIKPFFHDIAAEGSVKFSFDIHSFKDENLDKEFAEKISSFYSHLTSKNVQAYFQNNIIDDKIGFWTSIIDSKNNLLSDKSYDLQFMSVCDTFKNLVKIDFDLQKIKSIDDIFNSNIYASYRYIIIQECILDGDIKNTNTSYPKMHLSAHLYVLDMKNKKILYDLDNIQCISKSDTVDSAIRSVIGNYFTRSAKILRDVISKDNALKQ